MYKRQEGGFTLVELVMVILLLGVMATFSSQFIGIGTQIYGDASRREQLMSDARFALERLNREVRDAVPGSVRVEDEGGGAQEQGACLRFWPIATAGRYLETASCTVPVSYTHLGREATEIGATMAQPRLKMRLGDLLVQEQIISDDQLQLALQQQRQTCLLYTSRCV